MASESREEASGSVDLPAELREWLDERAAALEVERDELVAQILSSYHAAATLDGDLDAANLLDLSADDFVDVEAAVEDAVADRTADADDRVEAAVEDRLDEALAERLDEAVADRLDEALAERLDQVDADREDAVERLDDEFQSKIEDVRERVIQVKREADAKAPADHAHEEFAAIESLHERLEGLTRVLADLQSGLDERLADHESAVSSMDDRVAELEGLADRVEEVESKLNRVAWVVSDLKDGQGGRDAHDEAVDRIKRAAAQEGISTADCEQCGEGVDVSLLTDPECPHCNATVSDVRPTGGIFRTKARLVAASQLESGEDDDA